MYTLNSILVNKRGLDAGVKRLSPQEKSQRERTFCHLLTQWNNSTGSSPHSHRAARLVGFFFQIQETMNHDFISCWFFVLFCGQVHLSIHKAYHIFECSLTHCICMAREMLMLCKSLWGCVCLCVSGSLRMVVSCGWKSWFDAVPLLLAGTTEYPTMHLEHTLSL